LSNNYQYSSSDRKELKVILPKNYKKVLEVGCGTGGFRDTLNSEIEIWGIEPNTDAAQEAAQRGYKVLVGLYEGVAEQCPNDYFDLIVCNDVIEHMVDYENFLKLIKIKMTSDACLIGSIPNVRYIGNIFKLLINKDWKYVENGVLDRTHLRFFTEKSLKRVFKSEDFKIDTLIGINSDFNKWHSLIKCIRNVGLIGLILLTFGHSRDVRFMQFAFRLRK
jgi:2-polyprenyl-3-methyl-5-hydroxy-6-metoxy-1,4-benzoquinol methylase